MNIIKIGIAPLFGGILFSIGLGIAGMTEPAKIIGFLDIFGDWDASLIFVMIGAIGVNLSLYKFISKKAKPLFGRKFYLPIKVKLDKKLIFGSALFGIGWGIVGLCPGPGLTSIVSGNIYSLAFVATMLLGMGVVKFFKPIQSRKKGTH